MADLITVEQFTTRTRHDTPAADTPELAQLEALIADASALAVDIVADADTTDAWDAATAGTVPDAVVPVVVAMVRRELDNPDRFVNESTVEYSYQLESATGVHATRAEARALRRAAGRGAIGTQPLGNTLGGYTYLDGAWH